MKKIFYLAFLIFISCGQQKPAEGIIADSIPKDTVITTISPDSLPAVLPAVSEPELAFEIISVENNDVLKELVNNPYPKDLEAMKAMLDSMGATSEYFNGENGGLRYDSAEISFNRSYGESICEVDIRSGLQYCFRYPTRFPIIPFAHPKFPFASSFIMKTSYSPVVADVMVKVPGPGSKSAVPANPPVI